ncbi:MAG: hypothetical protein OES41_13680, partial [Rhodospirillales bacterium]|nr:hypothetical protein [Rhodospirillales bacterium]
RNGNLLGTVESRRFGFDDVQCVAFVQYWGQSGGDRASAGSNLLTGYYCADPGRPLTSALRKAVINGLGIRGRAVPMVEDKPTAAARTALPLQIWLEGPDRPKGLYFGKLFILGEDGQGDLEFRLPSPYGLCKGRWKFPMDGGEKTSSMTFDWSVDCANGQKAAGDCRIIEWEHGEGAGRMTDGTRLTLEFDS